MKIVLILLVVAACYALPTPDEWEDYKIKFNKTYADEAEDQMRKEIFLRNKKLIEEQNEKYRNGLSTWTAGLNTFADQTQEELSKLAGTLVPDL